MWSVLKLDWRFWEALYKAFGSLSQTQKLHLHFQLQELQKKAKYTSQYLKEAKIISDE